MNGRPLCAGVWRLTCSPELRPEGLAPAAAAPALTMAARTPQPLPHVHVCTETLKPTLLGTVRGGEGRGTFPQKFV